MNNWLTTTGLFTGGILGIASVIYLNNLIFKQEQEDFNTNDLNTSTTNTKNQIQEYEKEEEKEQIQEQDLLNEEGEQEEDINKREDIVVMNKVPSYVDLIVDHYDPKNRIESNEITE